MFKKKQLYNNDIDIVIHEVKDVNENNLIKITEPIVINSISTVFNNYAKQNIKISNIKNIDTNNIYKVKIPNGTKLVESRELSGQFRGFVRNDKNIIAQANLEKVNKKDLVKSNDLTNILNIATVITNSYYIANINNNLIKLSDEINHLVLIEEVKFKSKLLSLIDSVTHISKHSNEILTNESLKANELISLNNYNKETLELLNNVNLSLVNLTNPKNNKREDYLLSTIEIEKNLIYGKLLLNILKEISSLRSILHNEELSNNYLLDNYYSYLERSNKMIDTIKDYHKTNIPKYQINLDENVMNKTGIKALLFKLPAKVINENLNYEKIDVKTTESIINQLNYKEYEREELLLDKDVEVVVKGSEYYYLK